MGLVSYRTTVEPTSEPITLQEIKNYARIDFNDTGNDTTLATLISSARKFAEAHLNRALVTQTIQAIHTLEQGVQGPLYGPIDEQPNWYHYQEELGANPFGVSQFYFDLPMPPLQSVSAIEYQLTVFDNPNWTTFVGTTTVDTLQEPGRVYFQTPPTAYRWRFTYVAGYDNVTYMLPVDIKQALRELVAWFYDNREGDSLPDGLMCKLLTHRQWQV
jgi:hypothetical protein